LNTELRTSVIGYPTVDS